jgi:outer membrane protein assembly factor BamB
MLATACAGSSSPQAGSHETGLVLLSLTDGTKKAEATIGSDPVAVIVSEDGATAYVADSSPGDVYAVRLPSLHVAWRSHTGGAPFGLLLHDGRLFVSLFSGAAVVELDPATGKKLASHPVKAGPGMVSLDASGRVIVAGTRGEIDYLDGTSVRAGHGYAVAVSGGDMWTADYERAELVRAGDLHVAGLPMPLFPFWLAPFGAGTILVGAEGPDEDNDLGAVFVFDPATEKFDTLALARDPDQVLLSGETTFIAAHGDRHVLAVLADGTTKTWASNLPAVALAADPTLNVIVVVANDHE